MSETAAIVTRGLIKYYGDFQALYGVDMVVQRGEIFGFLGPNGAGKTTTIRCLLDLKRPNGGMVQVLGRDPQAEPVSDFETHRPSLEEVFMAYYETGRKEGGQDEDDVSL